MPARIESVAQAWDDYRALIVPKNAGPTQVQECRRAFYAGAESLFALIGQKLSDTQEVRDSDVAHLAALNDELLAFAHDVTKGRA